MLYEVTLRLTAYVNVDAGDQAAVGELARDKIAAGPCLCVIEGARHPVGHFLVKGMSAEVIEARPWVGNRRVGKGGRDEVASEAD